MRKKAKKKQYRFDDLTAIMRRLRGARGCAWDREQTHQSLLRYLKEESHELARAVKKRDWDNVEEELGDILLQVVFHAEIARQAGRFDIDGVIRGLCRKLVRRHPHVFDPSHAGPLSAREVRRQWGLIKAAEKKARHR